MLANHGAEFKARGNIFLFPLTSGPHRHISTVFIFLYSWKQQDNGSIRSGKSGLLQILTEGKKRAVFEHACNMLQSRAADLPPSLMSKQIDNYFMYHKTIKAFLSSSAVKRTATHSDFLCSNHAPQEAKKKVRCKTGRSKKKGGQKSCDLYVKKLVWVFAP